MNTTTTVHLNIYSATRRGDVWDLCRYGRRLGREIEGDRFAAIAEMRRLHAREIHAARKGTGR